MHMYEYDDISIIPVPFTEYYPARSKHTVVLTLCIPNHNLECMHACTVHTAYMRLCPASIRLSAVSHQPNPSKKLNLQANKKEQEKEKGYADQLEVSPWPRGH